MRILTVGTGGAGSAFAGIARRRSFFEHCALADYDRARSDNVVSALDDGRFSAHAIDASSRDMVVEGVEVAPRDVVVAALPDPATLGERMTGKTCAWKGTGVLGPEAFPPQPFLDSLADYGAPHGVLELEP